MNKLVKVGFALVLVLGLASLVAAGDVTLEGKVTCAKCGLKKAEACQNALVVAKDGGQDVYYIAANEVAEKFGHVCEGEKKAKVTGTVTEKDGQKWITASAMEEVKS
jgi:hypothetical protein